MSLGIRELSESDLVPLLGWEALTFPEEPWSEKNLKSHLEFHRGFVLEDPEVSAYALICETPWEIEIFRIATLPKFRRLGKANLLLTKVMELFPSKDFFLEVKENNIPAQNLYLATGFTILEKRKNYYPDGSTAILMKKDKL